MYPCYDGGKDADGVERSKGEDQTRVMKMTTGVCRGSHHTLSEPNAEPDLASRSTPTASRTQRRTHHRVPRDHTQRETRQGSTYATGSTNRGPWCSPMRTTHGRNERKDLDLLQAHAREGADVDQRRTEEAADRLRQRNRDHSRGANSSRNSSKLYCKDKEEAVWMTDKAPARERRRLLRQQKNRGN